MLKLVRDSLLTTINYTDRNFRTTNLTSVGVAYKGHWHIHEFAQSEKLSLFRRLHLGDRGVQFDESS